MKRLLTPLAILLIMCMIIPLASCKEVLPSSGEALTSSPGNTPSSQEPQSSGKPADDWDDDLWDLRNLDYQIAYRHLENFYDHNGERAGDFDEKLAALKMIIPEKNVDLAVTDYEKALEEAVKNPEFHTDEGYKMAMNVLRLFYGERERDPSSFDKKLSVIKNIFGSATVDEALKDMEERGFWVTAVSSNVLANNIMIEYLYDENFEKVSDYDEKFQGLMIFFDSEYVHLRAEEIEYEMADRREFGRYYYAFDLLEEYLFNRQNNKVADFDAKLEALKLLCGEKEVEGALGYHDKIHDPGYVPRVTLGC